jgi:hypothetical protein
MRSVNLGSARGSGMARVLTVTSWRRKMSEKKLWSKQTIEERVRNTLRHQEELVNRLDPDDQNLTHDNAVNDPVRYVYVDLNRHFLRVLQTIVEETKP